MIIQFVLKLSAEVNQYFPGYRFFYYLKTRWHVDLYIPRKAVSDIVKDDAKTFKAIGFQILNSKKKEWILRRLPQHEYFHACCAVNWTRWTGKKSWVEITSVESCCGHQCEITVTKGEDSLSDGQKNSPNI